MAISNFGPEDYSRENDPSLMLSQHRTLTVGEVARLLHVHANSVRRWADEGLLPAYRMGRRGDRRFGAEAVENFLKRQG